VGQRPAGPGGTTTTDITGAENGDYTKDAHAAVLAAARDQHDFGGWIASVLASVASDLGSTSALTAGRPGSWEADLVQELVKGTVGWDDDYLAAYRGELP
jgi:hypothetical protein